MAKLPQEFLDRMKVQLGDEYGDFEKSMNEKGYAGLRVNTGKISVKEFLSLTPFSLTPVPWTENGFYYRKRGSGYKTSPLLCRPLLRSGAKRYAAGFQTSCHSGGYGA